MSIEENSKFIQWHNNQISNVFDLQKELEEYCKIDVDLL
jgi:hypothetical protein